MKPISTIAEKLEAIAVLHFLATEWRINGLDTVNSPETEFSALQLASLSLPVSIYWS